MGSSGVEAVDRKQKIRDRYKGVDASELEVIPAKAVEGFGESTSVRRVAAYVRVSTDNDEQTSSYELQKNYYTEYIKAQPGWEFVGIYDDEGISGTSLEHRKGMQQLIEDCKAESRGQNGQTDDLHFSTRMGGNFWTANHKYCTGWHFAAGALCRKLGCTPAGSRN